jgi:8-oxo-dGTP diphosphatase
MNLLYRVGYRVAFALLRVWWIVRRPHAVGAVVAVWQDGRLLVLRMSYRRALDLPGGGIEGAESPLEAAVRELREERGLQARSAELAEGGVFEFEDHHRRITTHIYVWRPALPVHPLADRREILSAMFLTPDELARERLATPTKLYLATVVGHDPSGARQISRA